MTPYQQSLALIKWSKPGIIYVARNRVNGNLYVGQTTYTLSYRSKRHERDSKNGSDLVFHEAIRKYGEDAFEWYVLQVCNDRRTLNVAEKWWIKSLGCLAPNGYNLTTGGDGALHTERTKKKISAIAKKWATPERMKSMSELAKKVVLTQEQKDRKSAPLRRMLAEGRHPAKGKKWTPEHHAKKKLQVISEESRKRMGDSRRGRHHSEETKRKIGLAHQGRKLSPEHIEKRSNSRIGKYAGSSSSWYGKHHTEESLVKMSKSHRGAYPSEETRRKMSETHKKIKSHLRLNRRSKPNEKEEK